MVFRINVPLNYKNRWYNIERLSADDRYEVFRITGRDRSVVVVVRNNRPFIRGKGLKHHKITWDVIEGNVRYPSLLEPFCPKILAHLEPK